MKKQKVVETLAPVATAPALSNPVIQAHRDRRYKLVAVPASMPRGQRSIIFSILESDREKVWSLSEVATAAEAAGLKSLTPIPASCKYHLHNMMLQNFVELVDKYPDHVTFAETVAE